MRSLLALIALGAILSPVPALAYIGPGAGLGVIGTVVALIGAVLLAIVGFVWYPVKRMLKKRKAGAEANQDSDTQS